MKKSATIIVMAMFSMTITFSVVVGICWKLSDYYRFQQTHKTIPAAYTTKPPKNNVPSTMRSSKENLLALATVGHGEGIENAFIRQLLIDPLICDGSKYCPEFSGNRANPIVLKRWAGRAAHILACKEGYADCKYGAADIRVAMPDTMAYVIQKATDGKISVQEYHMDTAVNSVPPSSNKTMMTQASTVVGTHFASTTIAASQFLGLPDVVGKLPGYEYRHIG